MVRRLTFLAALVVASVFLSGGSYDRGGYAPEGGYQGGLVTNWRTVKVAISPDANYLEPDSLKANGGAYDYIINTDNSPGEFLGGTIDMTNQNQQMISGVVDNMTLAGTGYWADASTIVGMVYLPLDDLPGFLFDGTEVLSADYTMFWRAAGYTLSAGDSLFVVGCNLSALQWPESGNYGCSNNYMDVLNTTQWPSRNASVDPINWGPVGLNAVSDLAYADHPYLVNFTSSGINDSSAFDVAPWAQTIAEGSFNGGLWYLGARSTESGTTNLRAGSCTSTDGAQNRPRLIIEYRYKYFTRKSKTATASYPLGGHAWSSAIGHNEQYWALGGDVGGTWTSIDGGFSWENNNEGITNDQDQPVYYTRDIIPVKNSYFEGFVLATDSGIFKKSIPFSAHESWTPMMDVTDNNYLSYQHWGWGDWLEVIGFCSLDWDGDNLLAATAGRNRYNSTGAEEYYPWNVADGDSLTGDVAAASWSDGDWSDNAFGKAGLWIYDYTQAAHGWHPVEDVADSYRQEWVRYKSVSVAVVGNDTLYAVATSAGPKLLTVSSSSKTWADIDQYDWQDVSLGAIDGPLFAMKATTETTYHYNGPDGASSIGDGHVTIIEEIQSSTPATGTVTVGGNGYAYVSWSGSTFDISGTLSTEIAKGANVIEPTDSQATWSVMITGRGDIYCVIANEDQQWGGDSGLYKLDYGKSTWKWVGDGTGLVPVEGGTPGAETDLLSVADIGMGAWVDNPLSPTYAYNSSTAARFGDGFVWVSGNDGSGTDPDTLYLGGNASVTTYRALVPAGADGGANTPWDNLVRRDYTTDPFSEVPQPDLAYHTGISETAANFLIHEVAVDPENSDRIFITPSDQGYYSTNGGTNWTNNVYTNSPTDSNFFKATGYDEICVNGVAVLSDGRLITARGDVFAGITQSDKWEYSTPFRPLGEENTEDCTDNNTDDALWGYESGSVIVTRGWAGENPTDDYVIFNNGDIIQGGNPCKLFLVHDDNDDGDFFDSGEWENITADLPSANKYLFPGNHVTNGTDKIWVCFERYNKVICDFSSSRAQSGVLEITWNDPNWEYAILDTTSTIPINEDFRPMKLQYDSDENRLWATVGFNGDGGGVYMIDLDSGSWLAVVGEGAVSPYDSYEPLGDFLSLRMSNDNSVVYFGSTGRAGKSGGIWRITNPDAVGDGSDPFTIERVLNTAGMPYAPTITTSRFYNSRESSPPATATVLASKRLMCSDILIDPFSNDKIWFVSGGNYNRMSSHQGLYALDTIANTVVDVFADDPRSDFAETRAGISLIYTDAVDPPRILWGTHCVGVSFFEYNGVFPTE